MAMRDLLKSVIFTGLSSPLQIRRRLDRLRSQNVVTVLNLHRVAENDGSDYRPLNPSLFDELLSFATRNYEMRTFSNLDEPSERPRMILSFDDGYRDFLDVAMPVLERYGVRVNQNIIPGCVDRGIPPFNVVAQDFVGKAPIEFVKRLSVPGFAVRVDPRLGLRLSAFLKNRSMAEQDELRAVLEPQFARWADPNPTQLLSLAQIRQVAEQHEVGGHSFDHASMSFETTDYLRCDIDRCKKWFREKLKLEMAIYAFPNGSISPGQIEVAHSAGLRYLLLVGEKFSASKNVHHRITFDARTKAEVRYKAVGARSPINSFQ